MDSLKGHKVLLKAMKECGVNRLIDWATPSVHFEKDTKSFFTVIPRIIVGIIFSMSKEEIICVGNLITSSDLD